MTAITALAGGTVDLAALQTVSGGAAQLTSDGAGSVLELPVLGRFGAQSNYEYLSSLQVTNSGTVNDGSLTGMTNVSLIVSGSSENLTLAGLTTFNSGDSCSRVTPGPSSEKVTVLRQSGHTAMLCLRHLVVVLVTQDPCSRIYYLIQWFLC